MSNGVIVSSVIDLIESRRDDAAPHSCGEGPLSWISFRFNWCDHAGGITIVRVHDWPH